MPFKPRCLSLAVLAVFALPAAQADEVATLDTVQITAEPLLTPTKQADETVYTGTEVTARGIETQGAKATMRVHDAIDMLPGVNSERPDAGGLAVEQSSVRMRGVKSYLGTLTVEGVPNWGGNPIGPRDYLYDLANFEAISVYKGAVPADVGTGVGARGGAIVLHPRWPSENFGAELGQAIGGNDFRRTYVRVDSGTLNETGTRFAAAYSHAEADKWRGPGELGPRDNANLVVAQPLGEAVDVKLWVNHNDQDQHLYRPLTYTQVGALSSNYDLDYNAALTGSASQDIYYYDYNKGHYKNDDILSVITVHTSPTSRVTLKPYYATEDSLIYQGTASGGGRVQTRSRDIDRWGVIAEAAGEVAGLQGALGYHYENAEMDIATQNYAITASGLDYRGYGVLATAGTAYLHSPYAKLAGQIGAVNWQAGLKYFRFEDPASAGYTTGPGPTYALVRAPDLDRDARSYSTWLPTLGASYDLDERTQVYASYGRNFIRPYSYIPLINTYNNNRTAFQAAGVNLAELFAGYDMEKSDTLDLGLRYRGERYEIMPTLFYGKHDNLLVTVSDARVLVGGKPVSYQQNVGQATSYGMELGINLYLDDHLTAYFNPTWTRLTYDDDLTYQGTTLATAGKQVVDTPVWMASAGLIYRIGAFEVQPSVRFVGSRYGDSSHAEKIDAYAVADLALRYTDKHVWPGKTLKASLELSNLFDKEYVAVINASDDNNGGNASYYTGAPFTAMFTIGVEL